MKYKRGEEASNVYAAYISIMTNSAAESVYDEVQCQHCTGDGCSFCDAIGRVFVKHPAEKCSHCEGVGCFYCGYTGWNNLKGKYD